MSTEALTTDGGDAGRGLDASYPGGKGAAGVAQKIAAQFPPHAVYVELCLGHGRVLRHKRPALYSIGVESNEDVVQRWRAAKMPGVEVKHACALKWLEDFNAGTNLCLYNESNVCIYVDPPYPEETRSDKVLYGEHEWDSVKHTRLLRAAIVCPSPIFISTYPNVLYYTMLEDKGFAHIKFEAMTRGGMRTEQLWYRIPGGDKSLGARSTAAGRDYRERERIKRKVQRNAARFGQCGREEQRAILEALIDVYGGGSSR